MKKITVLLIGVLVLCGLLLPAKAYAVNLAAGMPVIVNDFYSPYVGANATDSDYTTYWNAGDHGYSANPNWLYVDLGSIHNINRIKLVGGYNGPVGANQWYGFKNFFRVYISSDASTWTSMYDGMLTDTATGRFDDRSFSPLTARYVRYLEVGGDYMNDPTLGFPGIHWSHLAQMEVYGVTNVIPEPATLSLLGFGLIGLGGLFRRKYRR